MTAELNVMHACLLQADALAALSKAKEQCELLESLNQSLEQNQKDLKQQVRIFSAFTVGDNIPRVVHFCTVWIYRQLASTRG